MLDPGLVARARRWGLFSSFSILIKMCSPTWTTRKQLSGNLPTLKSTMNRSKTIFTGSQDVVRRFRLQLTCLSSVVSFLSNHVANKRRMTLLRENHGGVYTPSKC